MPVWETGADFRCCEGCRVRKVILAVQQVWAIDGWTIGFASRRFNQVVYQFPSYYWQEVTQDFNYITNVVTESRGPLNGPIDPDNPPVPVNEVVYSAPYTAGTLREACWAAHDAHAFAELPDPPEGSSTWGMSLNGRWTTGNGLPYTSPPIQYWGVGSESMLLNPVCYPAGESVWTVAPNYIGFAVCSTLVDVKGKGCLVTESKVKLGHATQSDVGFCLRDIAYGFDCELVGTDQCEYITRGIPLMAERVVGPSELESLQFYAVACKSALYKFIIPECGFCPNPAP